MKLPHTILLAIALAAGGAMLYLNLALQGSYPITVTYTLPRAAGRPQEERRPAPEQNFRYAEEEEEAAEAPAPHHYGGATEEGGLTGVTFPLELNAATEEQLKFIPQVGNVTAQRIVQYRDYLGGYTKLEQLKGIKGIGEATYRKLAAYLYVKGEEEGAGEEEGGSIFDSLGSEEAEDKWDSDVSK